MAKHIQQTLAIVDPPGAHQKDCGGLAAMQATTVYWNRKVTVNYAP
jgi:hypothetical protein